MKQIAQRISQPKSVNSAAEQAMHVKKLADSHSRKLDNLAKGMPILDGTEVLDLIIEYVETKDEDAFCTVHLINEEATHLICKASSAALSTLKASLSNLEIEDFPNSLAIAAQQGIRAVVEDLRCHADWQHHHARTALAGLIAVWIEPIRASTGKVIGTFSIFRSSSAGPPSDNDLDRLQNASNLARIALERKSLQEELLLAASVYQNSSEAIMITDQKDYVVAVNPAFTRITGYPEYEVIGKPQRHFKQNRAGGASYKKIMQILRADGHWQGEIWSRHKNGAELAVWLTLNSIPDEIGDVYRHICLFSDITEKKRSEELIWKQANYDALTLLPNRRLFFDRLQLEISKSKRTGKTLVLMMIDLDGFKAVNDQLGHAAGDHLLKETAKRLRGCVREGDTVARLGGDEFILCIPQIGDIACIERIARSINQILARSIGLADKFLRVSGSIGIAEYPKDADNMDDLLKHADQAMYASKKLGRNRYSRFTSSIHEESEQQQQLINCLRYALDARQFKVHFQPIVDLATDRIIKAEALLRWTHPLMGKINPAVFIPIAEEIGLIGEIGDWVFQQAVQYAKRWGQCSSTRIQISINISPIQLLDGGSHNTWTEFLQKDTSSAANLAIEITEGLLLNEHREVTEKLMRFRELGIQIALDDFGTGYSSLSYLMKFKADYIKIDRSFIEGLPTDPSCIALCEAIIAMSHRLGLKVIAEGVETKAQRDQLRDIGCDYAQGYLFSKPVPAEEMEQLLLAQSVLASANQTAKGT
ncbi:putative bifunctional diguanylate cyclase/phosphodiesterase [Candidatus Methylospira mobilis]|uniref:putative bifunctional diguanylate cyclase/phosphodiesterase n=1 Tax=Candidatus Methylospira mobilis TaxID=1808979 RepID=UPI001884F436|nr:EAL domain-containing protein [Candidatus Methylospira mobilis]